METKNDFDIEIWDMHLSKQVNFLQNDLNDIKAITFSPDSKAIVAKNEYRSAGVWELVSGKQSDFLEGEPDISDVYFSPNGKWMVTTNKDLTATMWEFPLGKRSELLKGEKEINDIYFSPDSKLLVTTTKHTVTCWNIESGNPITKIWLNEKVWQGGSNIAITEGRWLFILVGEVILKIDLENQKGNFFSYGDGESLDIHF
jgi:WD40 repeat protein